MIEILGKATSINVRKVLWNCAEIGIVYQHSEYGSGTANSVLSAEFSALNPNAMVPVLRDEFGVLWESNTICRYLANRFQAHQLLPTDAMARAQVEKWMDWQATELNTAWRYVFMALVRQHPHFQDADKIKASADEWNRLMTILDHQLASTGAYVTGSVFTLADIVLGLSINRWRNTPMQHVHLAHVDRYFELLCEREGFRRFGANGIA